MTNEELERTAYISGDIELAQAYTKIEELELQVDVLENAANDVVTMEIWESKNGPAKEYYDFFHDCFARLNGHYPYPSVTSDYDKSVIFNAISKGDGVTE